MRSVVAKTVEELDLWLDSRERDARNLSEMEVFAAACRGQRRLEAEQPLKGIHQRSPCYENVFLADAAGKLFLDSIDGKSVGIDISALEGFRINVERARQGQIWVGDAMKSPATGRPVSLMTAPIVAGGELVGILGTPIELSEFSNEFINKQKVGATGYVYMMDASGLALAHPDAKKILTLEENTLVGGFGSGVMELLSKGEKIVPVKSIGIPDAFITHGSQKKLRNTLGIDREGIQKVIKAWLKKG